MASDSPTIIANFCGMVLPKFVSKYQIFRAADSHFGVNKNRNETVSLAVSLQLAPCKGVEGWTGLALTRTALPCTTNKHYA